MSRLLDVDPLNGAVEMMDYDHETGSLLISRTEDVTEILDLNEASYNDSGQGWRGQDNDFWHFARVPLTVLQGWLNEFNKKKRRADRVLSYLSQDDAWQTFLFRRLNSSEYRRLKVAPIHS